MTVFQVSDLKDSLQFSMVFDPENMELICDIEDHVYYKIHTIISHQKLIMRNILTTHGESRNEHFIGEISHADIAKILII